MDLNDMVSMVTSAEEKASMPTYNEYRRCLLLHDPYDKSAAANLRVLVKSLKEFGRRRTLEIQVAYVIAESHSLFLTDEYRSELDLELEEDVKKNLTVIKKELSKWAKASTYVLKVPAANRRAIARAVMLHAEDFDFIAVNTHSRKGIMRKLVGSFTEELLNCSTKPLFIVSPTTVVHVEESHQVLFASDFSASSLGAFDDLTVLRRDFEFTFYHHRQLPSWMPVSEADKARIAEAQLSNAQEKLKEVPLTAGEKKRAYLSQSKLSTSQAIVQAVAKKNASLVVVAQSNDFTFTGATIRNLLCELCTPILVMPVFI